MEFVQNTFWNDQCIVQKSCFNNIQDPPVYKYGCVDQNALTKSFLVLFVVIFPFFLTTCLLCVLDFFALLFPKVVYYLVYSIEHELLSPIFYVRKCL